MQPTKRRYPEIVRSLIILGSTGSVGTQALDVVRRHPDRFRIVGLSSAQNHELLVGQIREFLPPMVAVADEDAAMDLKEKLEGLRQVEVLVGPDAARILARETEADLVLNAIVGAAGLEPTLAALQSGKTVALANKESLIVGGELVLDLIKGEPERLVPVDSEHAALAQCVRGERREDLRRVIITGSGGPFRGCALDIAYRVGRLGLTYPAVMNAANEVAVAAFLEGRIPLTRIIEVVETVLDAHEPAPVVSAVSLERADQWARREAVRILTRHQ